MTASKLSIDAQTASALGCKPGEEKTVEVRLRFPADFDPAAGGEVEVLGFEHYEDEPTEEAPAEPAPQKTTKRPPAVSKMMTPPA